MVWLSEMYMHEQNNVSCTLVSCIAVNSFTIVFDVIFVIFHIFHICDPPPPNEA